MRSHALSTVWLVFLIGFCVALLAGCNEVEGSGNITTREIDPSGVGGLDVCCGWVVKVEQGDERSVIVEGDDNIIDAIEWQQNDDLMRLRYADPAKMYKPTQPVHIRLTTPNLTQIKASNGTNVQVGAFDDERRMDFTLSEGSELDVEELKGFEIDTTLRGGSNATIHAGSVTSEVARVTSGSVYDASGLETLDGTSVRVAGGSNATVWATKRLRVNAVAGSTVEYYGAPTVEKHLVSSTLEHLGDKPE